MKSKFIKSISVVFFISIVAKVLGFIKQIVLANIFGANQSTDIFFSSYFFIIEISTAFFTALSTALILSYGKAKKNSNVEVNNLFSKCFVNFLLFSIVLFIILFFMPNVFAKFIAPGYADVSQFSLYIKYLSPIIVLFYIQTIYNSILEYEKKFIPTKTLSLYINLFCMLFAILFAKKYGTMCLIYAVLFAFIIQTIESYFFTRKYVKINKNFFKKNKEYSKLMKSYVPLFIGSAIAELNSIIDRSIASNLEQGAVSAITYGASVNEIITVLLIGSVVSVFYPYITHDLLNNNSEKISDKIKKIMFYMIIFLIPITLIFLLFSNQIVSILYYRGSFDFNALQNTTAVVFGYAIGFIPLMIRNILTKVHYAYNDSKSPMFNGIITIIFNITFSIVLSRKIGIIGIPIASSLSYVLSSVLYFITIKKHITFDIKKNDIEIAWKTGIILFLTIIYTLALKKYIIISSNLLYMALIIFLVTIFYLILLLVFKIVNLQKIKYYFKGEKK